MSLLLGILVVSLFGAALIPMGFDQSDSDGVEPSNPSDIDDSERYFFEASNSETTSQNDAPVEVDGREGEAFMLQEWLEGGSNDDTLTAGPDDVLFGGDGNDHFNIMVGETAYIQDFQDGDLVVVSYDGEAPEIDYDNTDEGISILANGLPVAMLNNVWDFDQSSLILSPSSEA
jgi:hypothetical protein